MLPQFSRSTETQRCLRCDDVVTLHAGDRRAVIRWSRRVQNYTCSFIGSWQTFNHKECSSYTTTYSFLGSYGSTVSQNWWRYFNNLVECRLLTFLSRINWFRSNFIFFKLCYISKNKIFLQVFIYFWCVNKSV